MGGAEARVYAMEACIEAISPKLVVAEAENTKMQEERDGGGAKGRRDNDQRGSSKTRGWGPRGKHEC